MVFCSESKDVGVNRAKDVVVNSDLIYLSKFGFLVFLVEGRLLLMVDY